MLSIKISSIENENSQSVNQKIWYKANSFTVKLVNQPKFRSTMTPAKIKNIVGLTVTGVAYIIIHVPVVIPRCTVNNNMIYSLMQTNFSEIILPR